MVPGAAQWFILPSEGGSAFSVTFGGAGGLDQPAPADYDGDGRADLAAFRPISDLVPGAAQWFILPSGPNDATFSGRVGGYALPFGQAGVDRPVPADYDGDGRAVVAAYRPTTSEWFILRSTAGAFSTTFGIPGDVPAPADYTGGGAADLAVFRPSDAVWSVRPLDGPAAIDTPFGAPGDVPTLAPLSDRDPRPGPIVAASDPASPAGSAAASRFAGAPLGLGRQAADSSPTGIVRPVGPPGRAAAVAEAERVRRVPSGDDRPGRVRGPWPGASIRPAAVLRSRLAGTRLRRDALGGC
ncbi:hypothetical protein [Tautonia plasticadhaerens]|uniref:hypothetical protein n=1 Tax=Tautonia plasticadhaerens TaxID=2527974 RepID=UPI0036F3DAE4